MRVRALLLTAAMLPASVLTLAASDVGGCTVLDTIVSEGGAEQDVLACESAAYFGGCDDAVGGKVYNQLVQGSVPLVLDAPTASFTAGAGCGTHEEPLFGAIEPGNPFYDLTIDGYFFGNVDEMIVELHDIYVGPERAVGTVDLDVRVEIDGESLFGTEELTNVGGDQTATTPRVITVPITPDVSSTGVSEALRFSIGDLYAKHGIVGVAGDGATQYHTVRVTVSVPPGGHAIVWGAAEIASGVYVNQGLAGTVLQYGTGNAIG